MWHICRGGACPSRRLSKNLYHYQKWAFSVARSAGFASCKTFGKQPKHPCFGRSPKRGEGGSPSNIAPFPGKGVFGKDAEIRTHQALHEAKPIECPKGDRDNKSEVYFKNRLFLQAENRLLNKAVLRIMQGDALDTDLILCYIIDTKRGKRQTVAP